MDNAKLKARMSGKVQELQQPPVSIVTPDTSPAPLESTYLALTNNALDIIRANLKSQPLSLDLFDIVKSPSGGSTVFSVPGLSGDEPAKELMGIVLDYTTPRAYWDTPDPVEGTPPVCLSQNSIISEDGKACAHCPFNTFGSKDGESNAKACKESVLLFLLRPNNIIPLLVRVPVTSKQGKPYALFNFEAVGTLSPEEAAQAKVFGQQFMEIVNATQLVPELAEAG